MAKFSVKYLPTALFSLKDSNATNSGAKSLFLPSPYAIKMALLNQIITIEGVELFNPEVSKGKGKKQESETFKIVRDAKISYYLPKGIGFCVNNAFVKILKPARENPGFDRTVSFREYIHITDSFEIIFEVADNSAVDFLKNYLHKINYFGKRGCFFQFLEYNDNPPEANVVPFDPKKGHAGLLQKYDDFDRSVTFEMVNNFLVKSTKRKEEIWVIPVSIRKSSKSFTSYLVA